MNWRSLVLLTALKVKFTVERGEFNGGKGGVLRCRTKGEPISRECLFWFSAIAVKLVTKTPYLSDVMFLGARKHTHQ